ncbi:MAPEG family protein [Pseudobacteriovorax antillogorgiicola]|uniref:Uncharacterized conserved protein, MAPEG superfamily n=1 Tax=Pseudobacteriovorax antillogorgiicola TaxID=1513793 RepID=A0A1Y6BG51_9BACT|nr:MAPEG family protein [Pseudobacteriovorax antillogorgiicola]TCS56396.1 putative MAPEG superfamily protein [Pseudobacteriovorax antillogorgiicola]SMF06140.1 Uncharacterized conserved protein, MAPEG superfamily [Pseudobacteriovorax antillogorgiicola]
MTVFAYIFLAALLNVFSKAPAVVKVIQHKKRYNNYNPRKQYEETEDIQRAYNAHLNTMEAFPVFATSMIVGHVTNQPESLLHSCGLAFIIARLAYVAAYNLNLSWQRSVIWGLAWLASLVPLAMAGFGLL